MFGRRGGFRRSKRGGRKETLPYEVYGQEISREKSNYHYLSIDPGYKNLAIGMIYRSRYEVTTDLRLLHFPKSPTFIQDIMSTLDELVKEWSEEHPLDFVLIEQQLKVSKYPRIVSCAILGYFALHYPSCSVYFLSTSLKGKFFTKSGGDIKVQTVEVALSILKSRGDNKNIKRIKKEKKKDDISDVIVQEEAFCEYIGINFQEYGHGRIIELDNDSSE